MMLGLAVIVVLAAGGEEHWRPLALLRCSASNPTPSLDQTAQRLQQEQKKTESVQEPDWYEEAMRSFGFLSGLGTQNREWGLLSEVAWNFNHQLLLSRTEIAHAIPVTCRDEPKDSKDTHDSINVVLHTGFAFEAAGTRRSVQGLNFSMGLKYVSPNHNYFVEAGVNVIPELPGLASADPEAHRLARYASVSSLASDDSRWLPLAGWGAQLYVDMLSLVPPTKKHRNIIAGSYYGGRLTLIEPQRVGTWLGQQRHMIGNVYMQGFLSWANSEHPWLNGTYGLHVSLSVSSAWPSDAPMPAVIDTFASWSVFDWLALRVYGGMGESLLNIFDGKPGFHLGFQLQLFTK